MSMENKRQAQIHNATLGTKYTVYQETKRRKAVKRLC